MQKRRVQDPQRDRESVPGGPSNGLDFLEGPRFSSFISQHGAPPDIACIEVLLYPGKRGEGSECHHVEAPRCLGEIALLDGHGADVGKQDADMVILLHRESMYERESPREGEADLIVAKHRNGPTDTITVAFQGHYSRFTNMATNF